MIQKLAYFKKPMPNETELLLDKQQSILRFKVC